MVKESPTHFVFGTREDLPYGTDSSSVPFWCYLPVPGAPFQQMLSVYQNGLAKWCNGRLNLFSGGALSRMSVSSLGIMPYYGSDHLPGAVRYSLGELAKDGESGQHELRSTRYLTVAALLNAVSYLFLFRTMVYLLHLWRP